MHENNLIKDYEVFCKYRYDIGADLVAYKDNKYYFIQCKNFNDTIHMDKLAGFYFLLYEYNLSGIVYYNGVMSQRVLDLSTKVQFINMPMNNNVIDIIKNIEIPTVIRDYQTEAYNTLINKQKSILSLPCRMGKTFVASLLAKDYNNIIILSPLRYLALRTLEHFKKFLGIKYNPILVSTDGKRKDLIFDDKNIISSTYDSADIIISMINDLLFALGEYGFIGNNSILFEHCKMGSNPEKANMHKKRLVLFREPPETKKFENSIIKELTGGGTFSARGHHETTTKKELNLTMIIECNKKPLFNEEPTDAETRRIIDLAFKSKFTEDLDIIDETKHIYQANSHYKTNEFQQKHKYALLTILFNAHKRYKNNNYILSIPLSIKERTRTYLELSCNIIQWFKDNYELTHNNLDICKMIDLYHDFTHSVYFVNLMKHEKRKYNKAYFTNYIKTNIFFKEYHKERYNNIRNCLICWKPIDVDAL
jgi:hypothetical protein